MWNDRYSAAGIWGRAAFDPISGTIALAGAGLSALGGGSAFGGASLLATGAGAGISAMGSIVGGNYAKAAGQAQQTEANFQATQATQQSATDLATAQATALDQRLKTSLAISSARAGAAFGGVEAGAGSALTNQKNLASRGEYLAGMDLWSGQNRATGDLNTAAGDIYGGEVAAIGGQQQQLASQYAAAGSIVGGLGKMGAEYTAFNYPTKSGAAAPTMN
jgi:hypothetical protein